MPKLTAYQWALAVVFLIFFGLLVYAMTRDYYTRQGPVRTQTDSPPSGMATGAPPARPGASVAPAMQEMGVPGAAEALASTDPVVLARRGDALFDQGKYQEAVPVYEKALRLNPGDVDSYNDLGLALHYTGRTGRAVEVLREGAAKGPEYQRIWLTLGYVQLQGGAAQGAAEALHKAIAIDPQSSLGQEARRLLGALQPPAGAEG